jgi:hypothetical protein
MQSNRTVSEEVAFKAAELDAALQEAGFRLAYTDPEAARDFAYRARYLRGKSTLFPLLNASLEYYHSTKTCSLKISTSEEWENRTYACLIKNYGGDITELLEQYFSSVRRGVPFKQDEIKKS